MSLELTTDELAFLVNHIDKLPMHEQIAVREMVEALSQRTAQQRAQLSFLDFMRTVEPGLLVGPQHKIIGNAFERIANGSLKRVIINIAPRHALRLGTPIPTVRGLVAVESLQVGDSVFGPDGQPIAVTGKSEVFENRELYRVLTDDGAYIDVDGEHLWTVRLHRKHNTFHTYTTEQLWHRQNGAFLRTKRGGCVELRMEARCEDVRLPMLPDVQPVQNPHVDLPVDPYVLGVWLGDGHSDSSRITMTDEDWAVVGAEIVRRGYVVEDKPHKYLHHVCGLRPLLRQAGVLNNKHIPAQYTTASVQQRRDLLKGLMDTDGNVSEKGQCFFAQSDRAFIEQVAQLVRSLGIKASIIETNSVCNGKDCGKAWKLSFYASDIAHLPRKEERTLKGDRHFGRYIKIEKLDETGDTQCITVSREDGLFLAGDGYICTHNSKSTMSSYLMPAWFMGRFPNKKVIMASHTGDLAVDFGRKVRNLIAAPIYGNVFPNVSLSADSKAAGRWNTNYGGEYYALGVGAAMAGRGGDLVIIDDPHSEQEAKSGNPAVFDAAYEWYQSGPRQRLQPGGAIVVLMTRWNKRDLTGRLIENMVRSPDGDAWEMIELPAIMPSGNPLWPEFWSIDELLKVKNTIDPRYWQAQYMQNPIPDEGAIVPREWWRPWDKPEPPECEYIIGSLDAAAETNNRADHTSLTVWGVFYRPDEATGERTAHIMLLESIRKRMEYVELKDLAYAQYKKWRMDCFIVEKKSAGVQLYQEMRRAGVPLSEFTPTRATGDKVARLNAVSDIIRAGLVWYPAGKQWAEDLIDEVAGFPSYGSDDRVDTTSMALARFRNGGFIKLPTDRDFDDEDVEQMRYVTRKYY